MDQESLKTLQGQVGQARGRLAGVRSHLASARSDIKRLSDEVDLLEHVAELLRTLVDAEITEGVKAVEALQTEGVRAVFADQDIEVKAEVEVLRGKVNVSLLTSQRKENGTVVSGASLDGFGGAVSTVQSVLLRLALLFRRGLRPVLFLDETLPAFDDKYVHNMAVFLKTLSKRLGVDILLVTHNQALVEAADRSYRIRRDKGGFSTLHRVR